MSQTQKVDPRELRHAIDGKWAHVREQCRRDLTGLDLGFDPSLTLAQMRQRTLTQLSELVNTPIPPAGFPVDQGGSGDPGMAVTGIEMLAQFDMSLMVKAGVQWGLFGGAISNLGTQRHHRAYIDDLIRLRTLGCFAMTETGHGSDVQSLETTATFDADSDGFVIHSPTPTARKDYIGNAACHGHVAAVFAQLIAGGENHGVHCFVVPIRDDDGHALPGVTITDCGYKGGLDGVDNGRLSFDQVRIPRENLLNRYADVDENGQYSSPIENVNKRFFTMLGTLVRGRVSVGGSARAAAEVALSIAGRYALQRRQFEGTPGTEALLMDYQVHQRRLLPLIAHTYAFRFAQNQLVARMDKLDRQDDPDPTEHRELESRAAGLKALQTWHASRAIQECREACGGAGYMAENRLTTLRGDVDVFTTFEGDNHVLLQLVAKELLTAYAEDVRGMDPVGTVRFAASTIADTVRERSVAAQLIQRLVERARGAEDDLLDRGTQLSLFEDREQHVLETVGRRLERADRDDPQQAFETFNAAQDHVLRAGRVHIERLVLEAFTAGIARCEDEPTAELLRDVCSLYALTAIEQDLAWFMGHGRISDQRAKNITAQIENLLVKLRPHTLDLIEGFGIPPETLGAAFLE